MLTKPALKFPDVTINDKPGLVHQLLGRINNLSSNLEVINVANIYL